MIVVKLEYLLAMLKEQKPIEFLIQHLSVYVSAEMWFLMKEEVGIRHHQQQVRLGQLVVILWWNFLGRKKSLELEVQCSHTHLLSPILPHLKLSQQQNRCLMQEKRCLRHPERLHHHQLQPAHKWST